MTTNPQQPGKSRLSKWHIWLPFLFSLVLVTGILLGMRMESLLPTMVMEAGGQTPVSLKDQGKIEELLRYIEAKYVDEVDREELIDKAIESILDQLDPHSNYIPADELRLINEQLDGKFEGIGVEFMILDDTVLVVAPLHGGPSEEAGILAGDRIVQVEDSTIAGVGITNQGVIDLLRGDKGTEVELGVLRGQEDRLRFFTITRDKIPLHSVDVAYMLDDETGYVKVNRFSATTYDEFKQALGPMVEKKGMRNLVIDLRHNPGGYLQPATKLLAQLFSERGELLVYTEGRSVHRNEYRSKGRSFFPLGQIVVLIDEGSASASEILAGAVQDHDRGLIVGRRSFGKGLVQEQYTLRDGSALRLTVARYYTPSGRSIQKPYRDPEAYAHDLEERLESGELSSADLVPIDDSTRYYTDEGRIVYGGGGIKPDIYVPLDTNRFSDTFYRLRLLIPEFVIRQEEDLGERPGLQNRSLKDFLAAYQPPASVLQDFVVFAREKGEAITEKEVEPYREELLMHLKAHFGKMQFGDEAFFAVLNQEDAFIQEALQAIRHPKPLSQY